MNTMFNAKVALSVLAVMGAAGCTEEYCTLNPKEKICQAEAIRKDEGLLFHPKRFTRSGGGTITIKDGFNAGKEIALVLSGIEVSIGTLNSNGILEADITPEIISKFKTGQPFLLVKQALIQRNAERIKFYTEPKFTNSQGMMSVMQRSVGSDQPREILDIKPEAIEIVGQSGLYVFNQHKFSMHDRTFQKIDLYNIQSSRLSPNQSDYPTDTEAPDNGSDMYRISGFAISNNRLTWAKKLAGADTSIQTFSVSPYSQGQGSIRKDWKTLTSLTADRRGNFTGAVINESLQVFRDQYLTDLVSVEDLGSGRLALGTASYGIGDIDGDGSPDLVIWHKKDAAISVYKYQFMQFVWDAELSRKLQDRIGRNLKGSLPTAVRLADIDSDGVDDVIVADGKRVLIFPNDGNGDYEETIEIPAVGSGADALGAISAIAVGKLGDNVNAGPSLALVSRETKKIAVVLNQSTE